MDVSRHFKVLSLCWLDNNSTYLTSIHLFISCKDNKILDFYFYIDSRGLVKISRSWVPPIDKSRWRTRGCSITRSQKSWVPDAQGTYAIEVPGQLNTLFTINFVKSKYMYFNLATFCTKLYKMTLILPKVGQNRAIASVMLLIFIVHKCLKATNESILIFKLHNTLFQFVVYALN